MSLSKHKVLSKAFTVLTSATTVLSLSGVAYLAPVASAVTPADYGLTEGNTISAAGSDDPDVYIVNEMGYKRLFLNPVIFSFYGHLGGFAAVKNVAPATRDAFGTSGLFRNCETGDPKVYGLGTTGEDTAMLHWVNTSGAQAVADDPNFFNKVFCINNNEFNWYPKGADYNSVNDVPVYSRGGGVVSSGPLSASLAFDNPASGTLVATQALADLAHFQVNGSGLVTSVELKRLGVSGDTTLTDVYLFVNGERVSDAGNVSSGMITFANGGGLFSAPANLSVRSTILTGTQGQTVGVQLTKLNSTMVSVSGNLHTIAANPTLAEVSVGAATGPGNFDPQNNINVWQSTFTITNEDVYLKRLSVREIGSIDNNHVQNLRLFVDGVQVATDQNLDADGYATFVLNHRLATGARVVRVMADVVGGSSRTMQFSLRGYYDVDVVDESYNVGVKATNSFPIEPTASTINSGSLTVEKAATSPASDVVKGANDVPLGTFTLTAFGEAIKVETLNVEATYSDSSTASLRNGRLLINGSQYGSTQTLSEAASNSFTLNYTVQPGSPVTVEVRADIFDNDGTDDVTAGDTIVVRIGDKTSNAQRVSSAGLLNVPATDVAGNTLTVAAGSVSLSKYQAYANQTVTIPNTALKLGHFVLTGNSSEDVNVNTIELGFNGADQWTASQLSNVYVKYGSSQTSPLSTVSGASSSSLSVSFTLAKNQTMDVEVYGNVSNFTVAGSNDTMVIEAKVSGQTAQSAQSVESAVALGQTMTAGTGSLATSIGSGNPVQRLVVAGRTVDALQVNFQATNDSFTLKEVKFTVANAAAASTIASVVFNGSNQPMVLLASGTYQASFTGLSIPVAANSDVNLTAQLALGGVGVGAATTSANAALTMTSVKYAGSNGVEATSDTDRVGNALYVHKANAVVDAVALPSSALTGGEKSISKFTVNGDGGTVGWKKAIFSITKTAANTISSGSYKMFEDGVDVTSAGVFAETAGANGTTKTTTFVWNTERQVSSTKTYEVKATLGGTIAAGASFITAVNNPSSVEAPVSYADVAATTASFVWTDRSASAHAEGTSDWMNDFLVKNLPLSQAMTN